MDGIEVRVEGSVLVCCYLSILATDDSNYVDCRHLHIMLTSIYIYFDWGYSVTHVYSFTLVGPSLHLATLAELAGRNDGRLDHVSCTVWRGPAIGVITLLREVCFNCYLLRLAWLLKPSSQQPVQMLARWQLALVVSIRIDGPTTKEISSIS